MRRVTLEPMVSGPVRNALLEPLAFSSTAWLEPAQELSAAWIREVSGGVVSWAVLKVRPLGLASVLVSAVQVAGIVGWPTLRGSPVAVVNAATGRPWTATKAVATTRAAARQTMRRTSRRETRRVIFSLLPLADDSVLSTLGQEGGQRTTNFDDRRWARAGHDRSAGGGHSSLPHWRIHSHCGAICRTTL